jgi:ketosteroid isomerase-like protein
MRSRPRVRTLLSARQTFFLLFIAWGLWGAGASFMPAFAALPHHPNHELHKEIEALEVQWRQAQLSNDVDAMDRLLADDYIGINANGMIETKSDALASRRAGTLHITSLDLSDLKVRVYGNTAVVTSRADLEGNSGQKSISGRYRYTRVYTRQAGQWKIVSFEASRIEEPGEHEKH